MVCGIVGLRVTLSREVKGVVVMASVVAGTSGGVKVRSRKGGG